MASDRSSRTARRAPPRARARRTARGGTLLGFMIGLVVGLAIAVVVALFVTRAPVPFVNKTSRASERVLQPRTPADAPDPNKPLYSKNLPAATPGSGAAEPAEERGSILDRLFGRQRDGAADAGAVGQRPAAQAPVAAARPSSPAEVKGDDAARDQAGASGRAGDAADRASYLLQAGAFRGREDADGMRAKLALLGFEARVLSAEVNGQAMYRVRVGPFAQLDEMNSARARLADNGIEASVVRQR